MYKELYENMTPRLGAVTDISTQKYCTGTFTGDCEQASICRPNNNVEGMR